MFQKLSNLIDMMSSKIPDSEKAIATEASFIFKNVINTVQLAEENLEILENAFEEGEISPEMLSEKRGLLNRHKQQIRKNYTKVKIEAFSAIQKFNTFSSDYNIDELINSFKERIRQLEEKVEKVLEDLDNFKSTEFKENLIKSIDSVKNESKQLEDLVYDRIITHIDENILGKDWVSHIGDKLNLSIEENVPFILQLNEQKQRVLDNNLTQDIVTQNPADTQKLSYPDNLNKV